MKKNNTYQVVVFSQRKELVDIISKSFENHQIEFEVCSSYQDLLSFAQSFQQKIIIADYYFDSFSGNTILDRIKKDFEVFPFTLFLLDEHTDHIIDQLVENGARDFLVINDHIGECIVQRLKLLMMQLEKDESRFNNLVLKEHALQVNAIINLVDDYILIREIDGRFITVNNSCMNQLKYSYHEFMILKPEDLVAPQSIFDYKLEISLLKNKKRHIYQTEMISKDKRIIPVEVSSSISNYQGREVIVSIARDISDRLQTNEKLKRLNTDLERINAQYKSQNEKLRNINREIEENRHALKLALKEAENAEKLKNQFLANMSHEIRTPMNAVVGFSQLLEDADAEDVPEFVRIINSNSETLLQLINDLMDIAKIESDLVAINATPILLHDLMMDIKTIIDFEKQNKGKEHIDIIYHIPENTEIEIETDKTRFKQILMNLMNNALKFTEEGSVEFGFTQEENGVNIFVKDTGIGIPIKMQQQIFERFQQIDTGTKPQGTGIGLSISRSLIRLLGGEIRLNSKINQGSVFSIFHPYSQHGNKKVKPPQKNMVMIAEDEEDNYHLLKYVLKDLNVDVIWAQNGQEAVDLCKEKPVSLILMDIKMPNKSGLEATKEILEFQPSLPIIAQTAYTQEEDIERCRRAGCTEFVAKPINLTDLRRIIAKFI